MDYYSQEATAVFNTNAMASPAYLEMKQETVRTSRDFFIREMEQLIIRPLAIQMGYIPDNVNVFSLTEAERVALLVCPDNSAFLQEAFWTEGGCEYVKGTRNYFPVVGPTCKYTALFDGRPEFDALRLSFLIDADQYKEVFTFSNKLQSFIEDNMETIPGELLNRAFAFYEKRFLGVTCKRRYQSLPILQDVLGALILLASKI